MAAVGDGNAVGGAQAAEVPPLHGALEPLALVGAGDVDVLAFDEMVGGDLRAHLDQVLRAHPELGHLALGFHLGDGEVLTLGARHPARLARAGAELQRRVAVLLVRALGQHLHVGELQHRDRHVLAGLREDPGHPNLLRDHSGAHVPRSFLRA